MTSFVYTEMEKLNPRTVLHERETSSSGRPKPIQIKEDADFFYTYTRSGKLKQATPKSSVEKYKDFLQKEVIYQTKGRQPKTGTANRLNIDDRGAIRLTPPIAYEIALGLGALNPHGASSSSQCNGCTGSGRLFINPPQYTAELHGETKTFTSLKQIIVFAENKILEKKQAEQKQAELLRLAKLRETTPTPKKETVFVAPPEIVENPISYSPLMIAGVIVVIVLFLRRRA